MHSDHVHKQAAPIRISNKAEGWREREEARNARTTPRSSKTEKREPALVRN